MPIPRPPRPPPQTYHAFLLRLWCEGDSQRWRASLQSAATEEVQHFPHAAALIAFLCQQMGVTLTDVSLLDSEQPGDPVDET